MEDLRLGSYVRRHQCEHMVHWVQKRQTELGGTAERVFVCGDFNTEPGETPYLFMKECGFKSAFEVVHGKEPDVTFFSRIKSLYAAREPPACFDYIFYQGEGLEPTSAEVTAD